MDKVCLVGCVVIDANERQARLGEAVLADAPTVTSERPEALLARVHEWRLRGVAG
jgi:hypothetical protein